MKGVIIYSSKYGSTKEYAGWLSSELKFPAFSVKKIKPKQFQDPEVIVLGSSVQMGRLTAASWLAKNWKYIKDKKVYLFSVSGTHPYENEKIQEILKLSLSEEMKSRIQYFPFPGRIEFARLPLFFRLIFKFAAKAQKDPNGQNSMVSEFDFVKREHIRPLVQALK